MKCIRSGTVFAAHPWTRTLKEPFKQTKGPTPKTKAKGTFINFSVKEIHSLFNCHILKYSSDFY